MAESFIERAKAVIPGGVNSPVRAWNGVGGDPVPIASASGAYLTDVQGRRYVDLVCSWGPAIVGHAHSQVLTAVNDAAARGLSFGAATEIEVELAEQIRARYAPAERVRLVSTGTEATMTTLRLARAFTGRELIVKFAGCYHGHGDSLLVAAGSGLATAGTPDSAGVTSGAARDTLVLPYGDLNQVKELFALRGSEIAAIITEAAPANMGVIEPPVGFNAGLAAITREHGALLIFDEVLTGFRAGPAGWWGIERDREVAAGREPWTPDLVTFGKVIGGGLPVAALAGREDVMSQLAPQGNVYQAGTLSGNPVAVAAGLATLALLDDAAYTQLERASTELRERVSAALTRAGLTHSVGVAGTLFSIFLGLPEAPRNFAEVSAQDTEAYASLFHHLWNAGVALPPSAYEAWFVSLSHGEPELAHIVSAIESWAQARA